MKWWIWLYIFPNRKKTATRISIKTRADDESINKLYVVESLTFFDFRQTFHHFEHLCDKNESYQMFVHFRSEQQKPISNNLWASQFMLLVFTITQRSNKLTVKFSTVETSRHLNWIDVTEIPLNFREIYPLSIMF